MTRFCVTGHVRDRDSEIIFCGTGNQLSRTEKFIHGRNFNYRFAYLPRGCGTRNCAAVILSYRSPKINLRTIRPYVRFISELQKWRISDTIKFLRKFFSNLLWKKNSIFLNFRNFGGYEIFQLSRYNLIRKAT